MLTDWTNREWQMASVINTLLVKVPGYWSELCICSSDDNWRQAPLFLTTLLSFRSTGVAVDEYIFRVGFILAEISTALVVYPAVEYYPRTMQASQSLLYMLNTHRIHCGEILSVHIDVNSSCFRSNRYRRLRSNPVRTGGNYFRCERCSSRVLLRHYEVLLEQAVWWSQKPLDQWQCWIIAAISMQLGYAKMFC